jgi:hypothetical protein
MITGNPTQEWNTLKVLSRIVATLSRQRGGRTLQCCLDLLDLGLPLM